MMKQVKCKFPVRMLAFVAGIFLSISAFAQTTVNGHVKDAAGDDVIGASVLIEGTADGTTTDIDGNFSLNVEPGARLKITYIGYQAFVGAAVDGMEVVLQPDQQQIEEVVVIGYGVAKKSDLTGSVLAMKPDAKNKGVVVNAQDMMQGKMAGVNVTSDGGTPGGGAKIRIRGGSSLNASNNPLIVIDGVAMDNNGVKGLANPLSMVNPQDIESFNVLKDASATAIYGSRGSNGVIIITTKKGRKGFHVDYNGSFTVSMKKKTVDLMDGDEFRKFVNGLAFSDAALKAEAVNALGTANTDWQDEIFRTAISHDHNVTLSGQAGDILPYRISFGYTNNQGILKTSEFERYTAALNLNPSLFDNHLKINLNAKGMWAKNRYADTGAIAAAVRFDPTQSIYDNSSEDAAHFGNFFQWRKPAAYGDPSWKTTYNELAPGNPLSMLEYKNDRAISRAFIGSADFDYQVHGFEDLRLHATLGADISEGKQATDIDPRFPNVNNTYYGSFGWEKILKRNFQLSAYAQYYHDFNDKAKNHFDIMAGYEWQHFWRYQTKQYHQNSTYTLTPSNDPATWRNPTSYFYSTENYLISFFGRANWSLMDGRYMVTATVRDDGASRFKDHWAIFPSFAFGWRMKDENAFKNIDWLSNLKLRLGWGMTGQQEGIGDYNYFAVYKNATGNGVYYPLAGNGSIVRPLAYDDNLKWETTTTYNAGLDWGLFNDRLTGSFDWYFRKTTDLLNDSYVPAGTNFSNIVKTNIGTMNNIGFEAQIDWRAIRTENFLWNIGYNFTYNHNEITDLTGGSDPSYYVALGGIDGGTGVTAQGHAVGHPASSFLVYQQVYDKNGKAIENAVVDRNGDGQISPEDKYFYKNPAAPVTMGLSSRMEYKNFDFGFTLRGSIGNYVFNNLMSARSNVSSANIWYSNYLENRPLDVLSDNWQTSELPAKLSDRWVQNASFLKCDNITLGYSFSNLFKAGAWNGLNGRIYGTASNVFTITNYDGIDPEVHGGIDNNLYPRPISFILGLNLQF